MSEAKVSMKLWMDKRGKRVLFAEGGKECVDFLFHVLTLPVATIIRLLQAQHRNLNVNFIHPDKKMETFLKPVQAASSYSVPLLAYPLKRPITTCDHCVYVIKKLCPHCGQMMTMCEQSVVSEGGSGLDDLELKPMSTISTVAMLSKFRLRMRVIWRKRSSIWE